jgi:transposase
VLAQLADSRMGAKIGQLEEAFIGRFADHHAFLLARMLARVDAISADIADLGTRIDTEIAPFHPRNWHAWRSSPASDPPPSR